MRPFARVMSIADLKSSADEILADLSAHREPLLITQNGEGRAVLQDVASYKETQEALALLKVLALGNEEVASGRIRPAADILMKGKGEH